MIRIAILPLLTIFALPAIAQETGDAKEGLKIAQEVCSECHAIREESMESRDPNAPAFPKIANTPGMTAIALRSWFQTPHPTMPNFMFTSAESSDLVAYILSLNKP